MSRAILIAVFGLLAFSPASSLAQAVPHMETLADDYSYALFLEKYCGHVVALDAVEVGKLQHLILSIMLDHGEASTNKALDAARKRLAAELEEAGLDNWCGYAAMVTEARYPELLRE